jgi:hypothetical protein
MNHEKTRIPRRMRRSNARRAAGAREGVRNAVSTTSAACRALCIAR